jgi:hypothetical protein
VSKRRETYNIGYNDEQDAPSLIGKRYSVRTSEVPMPNNAFEPQKRFFDFLCDFDIGTSFLLTDTRWRSIIHGNRLAVCPNFL